MLNLIVYVKQWPYPCVSTPQHDVYEEWSYTPHISPVVLGREE